MPFTLRHESGSIPQILNEGRIVTSFELDKKYRGVNMFEQDLEYESDKFVFFTPCIGEQRQSPRKSSSIYTYPTTLQNSFFFSFTDWLFIEKETGNGNVLRDLFLFNDFMEAIIEKTIFRMKARNKEDITRWDLLDIGDSVDTHASSLEFSEKELLEALEAQLSDLELDSECRVLGSVSLIGTTLISKDAKIVDEHTVMHLYTSTIFIKADDDIQPEIVQEYVENYKARDGGDRKRFVKKVYKQQKLSDKH